MKHWREVIFWTFQPFVTQLVMVVCHCEPECPVKNIFLKMVCCHHCQDHNEGSCYWNKKKLNYCSYCIFGACCGGITLMVRHNKWDWEYSVSSQIFTPCRLHSVTWGWITHSQLFSTRSKQFRSKNQAHIFTDSTGSKWSMRISSASTFYDWGKYFQTNSLNSVQNQKAVGFCVCFWFIVDAQ